MKYRRKPVERDVVDAVRLALCYTWLDAEGAERTMPHAEFEALYAPIVRKRAGASKPRTRKPRRRRDQQPDLRQPELGLPPLGEPDRVMDIPLD